MGRKTRPCKKPDTRQVHTKWTMRKIVNMYNFPGNKFYNVALVGASIYMAGAYMYLTTHCIQIITI